MSAKTAIIIFTVLVYIAVGFFAAEYLAGCAYFFISKAMPVDITVDTWNSYWAAYSNDPIQRKRLQLAAVMAGVVVYIIPLFILGALRGKGRSLHGDARWATAAEIRKAGLL